MNKMKILLFFLVIAMGAVAASADGGYITPINCASWRLAVEANNIRDWGEKVPVQCQSYISDYMQGQQYRDDINAVVDAAIEYAKSLNVSKEGKDLWVFNVDETVLSNVPFYARPNIGFGRTKVKGTKLFEGWMREGKAPPVPGVQRLYNTLLDLGIKPVFITEATEEFTQVRIANLKKVGYHSWYKYIGGPVNDTGTADKFKLKKRLELIKAGNRLVGNLGGWWDIYGDFILRTFKMPNPMYEY